MIALASTVAGTAQAQDVLIRDATVHTIGAAGVLEHTDVLVRAGKIAQIGKNISRSDAVFTVDAHGKPLTPGLWAGLTGLGVEEVSQEPSTVDIAHAPGAQMPPQANDVHPEFDIVPAYNPHSAVIGVNTIEGLSYTAITPVSLPGGGIIAGQGAVLRLDGNYDAALTGSRFLMVNLGGDQVALSGGSRAAQYMLLDQVFDEARADHIVSDRDLLTATGRKVLRATTQGGRVVFAVDRAADIRQVLALARRHGVRAIIAGGAEAWMVADSLARDRVPVLLDALVNLPASFDQLGARADNAALLAAAGVEFAFTQSGNATHNARKIRQLAGNAVAQGLDWNAALAALTANPARMFGVADRVGRIEVGLQADLVLWSGDPLEVTQQAEQVWLGGRAHSMRSRQTELRDRYAPRTE
jgi:imidazolonepropionase-like amidohydrolase